MKPTPYRGDKPFIFVSYAHADADRVYAEIDGLTSAGFNVFYDEGISPGHSWHDDLAHALEKCHLLLFFATARSVVSKNCLREIHFAEELDKPLLVVDLEDVDLSSGLKLSLGDQQAIKAFELEPNTYRSRIREALAEVVPVVSTASAAPTPSPLWTPKRTVALVVGLFIVALGFVAWNAYQTGLEADYASPWCASVSY